ncbi:hypothetical protein HMPREF9186_00125 [Streptococcus sp. F0442]|uniref:hypothetical protein n=1 Tax=Streptococcus sp. F0442 TaxID=999425 RepID=UPI0002995300|nr:hypothetical protein [Streptococcus sp. F0442]EKS21301.1 hypothetical protein HMPREF9186_00125 [Streptococcus sp. F0442]
MHYITETLGTYLSLKPYHHYSSIPLVRFEKKTADTFILCFKREMQLFVIDLEQDSGQSLLFAHASLIDRQELLEGIAAVPLEVLHTLYVLAFPRELYEFSEEARLKNIVALYQAHEDVLSFLKSTRTIGDQVTAYELEWKRTAKNLADFDPFRYTSRSEVGAPDDLSVVSRKDYDFIPDFHPFLYSKRGGKVFSIPADYLDPKIGQRANLEIMGWYLRDQQLKLRWKPKHTRKRRWRSSQLSIDIVSKHYFFQGEIYKGTSAPVFLDQLEFKVPQGYQADLEKAYQEFLSMVEERKRKALLRKVALGK